MRLGKSEANTTDNQDFSLDHYTLRSDDCHGDVCLAEHGIWSNEQCLRWLSSLRCCPNIPSTAWWVLPSFTGCCYNKIFPGDGHLGGWQEPLDSSLYLFIQTQLAYINPGPPSYHPELSPKPGQTSVPTKLRENKLSSLVTSSHTCTAASLEGKAFSQRLWRTGKPRQDWTSESSMARQKRYLLPRGPWAESSARLQILFDNLFILKQCYLSLFQLRNTY